MTASPYCHVLSKSFCQRCCSVFLHIVADKLVFGDQQYSLYS
uniref:Uncharacterized protein n=1 Tax=Arundo donax TaxID=35708 RepID=A0A0A9NAU2_ARUDO